MSLLRSLSIVEVIRYKAKNWNQTNYYSLNYDKLREWAEAESIEISEMWSSTAQGEEYQTLEMMNPEVSIVVSEASGDREFEGVDKGAVFRHWYDLSRELGYCSGQEVRDGEQWICLSGSWEKWESAVERGYSLEYLKKVVKRNQGK